MKIELITKKNRIVYLITYNSSDLISKIIVYEGLISDNIIYKKVFISHRCDFKISNRDLKKDLIRSR